MIKIVTAEENREALLQFVPEAMLLTYHGDVISKDSMLSEADVVFMRELREAEAWADCILIGPGIGMGQRVYDLLRFSISESKLPLVMDADALSLMAQHKELQEVVADHGRQGRTIILTPHLGEFAKLYECSVAQAKEHITEYPLKLSDRLQCIVVCKDARTVVVQHGEGRGYINTTGNAGMATAGSGDVLAGMITALIAQKMPGSDAAVSGVYLHGIAGDLAAKRETEISMTATDIIDRIGDVILMQQGKCEKNF